MNVGLLAGLVGGGGAALILRGLPLLNRPTLDQRLAPYLRDATPRSRLLEASVAPSLLPAAAALLQPSLDAAARRLGGWLGGVASVRRRLEAAGLPLTVEQFRLEQVLWGAGGLAGGVVLAAVLAARGASVPPLLLLCAAAALTGVLGRDRWLTEQVVRRERQILAELPTVAELLALAVTAGEGVAGALARVSRGGGELSAELRRVLADTHAGAPFADALHALSTRTSVAALARFVDGVTVALERGTPLGDLLRAQAADVREAGRRALIEAGGRKEIAMMIPVVFLVLPVTVIFALFPGFYGLSLATP